MSQRSRYASYRSQATPAFMAASQRMLKNRKSKSKSVAAVVKRVLDKQVETKCLQLSGSLVVRSMQATTTGTQFDAATLMVTPQGGTIAGITQAYSILANGIGQDQRIGDRVRIKGIYLDYLIYPLAYNATTNPNPAPQIVTVWVVRPKSGAKTGLASTDIISGANAKLFEEQTNQEAGLAGTYSDLLNRVDSDNYQVLARREYKLGYQGPLNSTNVVASFQSNDFNSYYKDRIKIKGFDWRVNRQDQYEGIPIYLFVTAIRADGAGQTTTIIPASFDINMAVYYTDL